MRTIRILNTSINARKPLAIALTAIYGIGKVRAKEIIHQLNLNSKKRIGDISHGEKFMIIKKLEDNKRNSNWILETDLKRKVEKHIKNKILLGTYQGIRHRIGLPVRGQRTHSNAKTQRALKIKG